MGFEVTLGEAWRSGPEAERLAKAGLGVLNSNHCRRLAIDLNLFKDGRWLQSTPDYLPLGLWWERQSTPEATCCWGGRFSHPDGNHFSLEHEGVK